MGMSVGPGGDSKEAEVMVEINTTPLIDVMLSADHADHHIPISAFGEPHMRSHAAPATSRRRW